MLDNGNVFIGWGNAPAFTQFGSDGIAKCDVAFAPLFWKEDHSFSQGGVMSYRTYKQKWVGRPIELPGVAFNNGSFFVSWNGASEVRSWLLEPTDGGPVSMGTQWKKISEFPWQGYENSCNVETGSMDARAHLNYRLTAKDEKKNVLGMWTVDTARVVLPYPNVTTTTKISSSEQIQQQSDLQTTVQTSSNASTKQLPIAALTGAMLGASLNSRRSMFSALFSRGATRKAHGSYTGRFRPQDRRSRFGQPQISETGSDLANSPVENGERLRKTSETVSTSCGTSSHHAVDTP